MYVILLSGSKLVDVDLEDSTILFRKLTKKKTLP